MMSSGHHILKKTKKDIYARAFQQYFKRNTDRLATISFQIGKKYIKGINRCTVPFIIMVEIKV